MDLKYHQFIRLFIILYSPKNARRESFQNLQQFSYHLTFKNVFLFSEKLKCMKKASMLLHPNGLSTGSYSLDIESLL